MLRLLHADTAVMEFFDATWKHYQPGASQGSGLMQGEAQAEEVVSVVQAQHLEPAAAGLGADAASAGGREQLAKAFTRSRL